MLTAKIKVATAVLLAVGTLALGAGVVANRVVAALAQASVQTRAATSQPKDPADGPTRRDGATASARDVAAEESRKEVTLRGRVLGIDGKPLAGARLVLFRNAGPALDLGSSAANGQFSVKVPRDLKGGHLAARGDNAGLDFINLENQDPSAPVELRLVQDRVIRGRIINTEGKPAGGVRVTARHIAV
jgi:hypothetical protein